MPCSPGGSPEVTGAFKIEEDPPPPPDLWSGPPGLAGEEQGGKRRVCWPWRAGLGWRVRAGQHVSALCHQREGQPASVRTGHALLMICSATYTDCQYALNILIFFSKLQEFNN